MPRLAPPDEFADGLRTAARARPAGSIRKSLPAVEKIFPQNSASDACVLPRFVYNKYKEAPARGGRLQLNYFRSAVFGVRIILIHS